ncbi:MAG: alpha/beta fold hydrolase [bacterium]
MTQTISKPFTEYIKQFENLPKEEQLFFLPAKTKAKGTVLCLHGFIAGPWQFSPLAEQLSQKGFNVFALRLANHDFEDADQTRNYTKLPLICQFEDYLNDAIKFINTVNIDHPIHLVGFSAGALVATYLSTQFKTQSLTLVSPFFGIQKKHKLLRLFQFLGTIRFFRDRLNRKILTHPSERRFKSGTIKQLQYPLGSLVELLNLADIIFPKAKEIKIPTHLLISDADEVIDRQKALSFYDQIKEENKSKTIFKKYQSAPHSMISDLQNPDTTSRHQAIQSIVAFCEGSAKDA